MAKEETIIVNKEDKIIGHKQRGSLNSSDIYRVSALWVQNSEGQILLAQRSFNKKNAPGKWGSAVAGTVERGETYESSIIKEAEEEIGLKNCFFQKSFYHFRDGENKHFTQWFFSLVDRKLEEFIIKKEEVEMIKWLTKEELLEEFKNNPDKFIPIIPECLNIFSK